MLLLPEEIEVNVEKPERNREFMIFAFFGKNSSGKLHNGFTLELQVDPRDVKNGHYQAYLLPDKRHIFVLLPALPASFSVDYSLVVKKETDIRKYCDQVQESRDVSRNAALDSEDRVNKHVVLKFPGYIELSNSIYSPSLSADGQINMTVVPYFAPIVLGNSTYQTLICRLVWKLHIVEAHERIRELQLRESTYEDDLVSALNAMQTSTTTSRNVESATSTASRGTTNDNID
jgi:hypothetical protein